MTRRPWPVRGVLRGICLTLLATAVVFAAWVAWQDHASDSPMPALPANSAAATQDAVARGAYLARVGNCQACHTAPGGAPYAGGRGIDTPFGRIYSSNLTPDPATGLGRWTASDFWRALHHGRRPDGQRLYPAFPYPHFTAMPPEDVADLHAFLRTLPAVQQTAPAPALRFPYNTQWALAVWRSLYFTPGRAPSSNDAAAATSRDARRGAYLINGPAHCMACHATRNALGGPVAGDRQSGGLLADGWYAPSLHRADEASVADWPVDDIVTLLKTGHSPRGLAQGPMADVVTQGTQHLTDADLRAMARYLRALPQQRTPTPRVNATPPSTRALGKRLYGTHCADCHGSDGQGSERGVYPPLAGSRLVTMTPHANLLRVVLEGGFGPATAGHPRPYGMPPFAQTLSNAELAALLTYLRQSWGNAAAPVSEIEVLKQR